MLTGENHVWMGQIVRYGLAIFIIIVFALPLLQYIAR